jgi:heme/copper-type cytochrome/quinol oxidase subunit 3
MIFSSTNITKVAFLFITYIVIAGGVLTRGLPCQLQRELETNRYLQHFIGFLCIFIFIMMEGGWDFNNKGRKDDTMNANNENGNESNKPDEEIANDFSNGNSIQTFFYSIAIYIVFIISSKMQLIPNLLFLAILFIAYLVTTQTNYWANRKLITPVQVSYSETIQNGLIGSSLVVLVYGFVDYVMYQKRQRGNKFDIVKFIFGAPTCDYEKKK